MCGILTKFANNFHVISTQASCTNTGCPFLMFSKSPFCNTQLPHIGCEKALSTRTALPTLLGLAGVEQDLHGAWVSMVFNPLLMSMEKKELTNVCKTQLSVTNKICSFDRTTHGCYLARGRADLGCK